MRFGQNKADKIQFVSVDKLFFGKQIPVKECMENNFFEEIDTGQDEVSRVSMFVFLPTTESNALDKLLARLISSPDILCEVVNEGISAPRRHEDRMGKLFENSANFSGFSNKAQIGEVLLKSKITVNEEGLTIRPCFTPERPQKMTQLETKDESSEGSTAFYEFLVMINENA
ncbi:serpin 9 [Culex quinquefasciatus]|uniref:Serpin 9 n=1 Tax=Culex quinquefasciatus TaxID=7176 RepID=B0WGQ7_CULQU|nr:serpin 9 [Culex quinquefasciatus]|eukprot:XP_001847891.1 serpin 9 [Culex quinquefasciatus]